MKTIILSLLLLGSAISFSQEFEYEDHLVPVSFVVVASFDDYDEALQFAENATAHLFLDLTLNTLHNDQKGIPNTDTCGCGMVHEYYQRGRFDDGHYLSVELTDRYDNLKEKKFVVMAYSGYTGDDKKEELSLALDSTQEIYVNAYIHQDKAYYGCMH